MVLGSGVSAVLPHPMDLQIWCSLALVLGLSGLRNQCPWTALLEMHLVAAFILMMSGFREAIEFWASLSIATSSNSTFGCSLDAAGAVP